MSTEPSTAHLGILVVVLAVVTRWARAVLVGGEEK